MSATGEAIAAAACGFVGTPFHHQARAPGLGLDCVGVAVMACRAAGRSLEDFTSYGRMPRGTLMPACESRFRRVEREPVPGDLVVFWVHRPQFPWHVAVCIAPGGMVHAFAPARTVVAQDLTEDWRARLVAVFDMTLEPEVSVG